MCDPDPGSGAGTTRQAPGRQRPSSRTAGTTCMMRWASSIWLPNLNAWRWSRAQPAAFGDFLAGKAGSCFCAISRHFRAFPEVELVQETIQNARAATGCSYPQRLLPDRLLSERDAILAATNDAGLMTRPVLETAAYAGSLPKLPRALLVAESLNAG